MSIGVGHGGKFDSRRCRLLWMDWTTQSSELFLGLPPTKLHTCRLIVTKWCTSQGHRIIADWSIPPIFPFQSTATLLLIAKTSESDFMSNCESYN